jgi:segregation and condensation protein B
VTRKESRGPRPAQRTRPPRASASQTIAPPPLPPDADADANDPPAGEEVAHVQLDLSLAVPASEGAEDAAEPNLATDAGDADRVVDESGAGEERTTDVGIPPAEGSDFVEEARELSTEHLRGLLEALIFASDKPIGTGELAKLASAPLKDVRALLAVLKEHYAGRGIVLDEVAGGWLFRTGIPFAPFVRELTSERPVRLTRAQIETLAITAYRQPITRPEIDEIRGVDSGATLKLLLERELVRILGKKDEPGRPLLYGTTTHFLEFFGLKSLKDLPTLREFTELSDESRRVAEAELGDVLGETAAVAPPAMGQGDELDQAPDDRTHDTMIPSAPPTGEVDDPDSSLGGSDE